MVLFQVYFGIVLIITFMCSDYLRRNRPFTMRRVTMTKKRADRRVTINGPVVVPRGILPSITDQQATAAALNTSYSATRDLSTSYGGNRDLNTSHGTSRGLNTSIGGGGLNSSLLGTPGNRNSVALPLNSSISGRTATLPKVRRISDR